MESLRQIGAGFLLAILSLSLVLGGFALSVVEGRSFQPSALPSLPVIESITATLPVVTEMVPPTATQSAATETPAETATLSASSTPPPTPASCLPPAGWVAIVVQSYDTLNSLAQTYRTTAQVIMAGNCLFSDQLIIGSFLYVPPIPTATYIPCQPRKDWNDYYVSFGDTLFNIALRYYTSVAQLQAGNCMGSTTFIQAGRWIKVPFVAATATPIVTATTVWIPTSTQVVLPTATDTVAPVVTDTVEPTTTPLPPTATPEPTLPAPSPTPEPPTATPPTPGG